MGKKAKSQRAQKRKMEKRARKEAKAALYKSYAEQGRRKGSKRSTLKNRRALQRRARNHPYGKCGNPGCPACYLQLNLPFLILMRQRKLEGYQYQETTRYKSLVTQEMKKAA
ncbi:MAG: hypothetical protein ACXABY_16545 [Candidatus Thorarchaeota archaeon]|jgi:hypothetical protein